MRRAAGRITKRMVRVAVVGCLHGKLDAVYTTVTKCEQQLKAQGVPDPNVDLVLITGDFQSIRQWDELDTMSVPAKYREIGDFTKYFTGKTKAPKLTIFIGGNHEASAHLMEHALGGFIAPNIYFLGIAGCIRTHGIRVAGVSGISGEKFDKPHYECQPFKQQYVKSAYKYRKIDFDRLNQLKFEPETPTVFLSHEWPIAATQFGDVAGLLKRKPFFKTEIQEKRLGDPNLDAVMETLSPHYWFASHLHVKHAAEIPLQCNPKFKTKFLSLDKILPRRSFMQIVEIPTQSKGDPAIALDQDWLAIIRASTLDTSLFSKNEATVAEYASRCISCADFFMIGQFKATRNGLYRISAMTTS
jgi:lariat debranching enzyme